MRYIRVRMLTQRDGGLWDVGPDVADELFHGETEISSDEDIDGYLMALSECGYERPSGWTRRFKGWGLVMRHREDHADMISIEEVSRDSERF